MRPHPAGALLRRAAGAYLGCQGGERTRGRTDAHRVDICHMCLFIGAMQRHGRVRRILSRERGRGTRAVAAEEEEEEEGLPLCDPPPCTCTWKTNKDARAHIPGSRLDSDIPRWALYLLLSSGFWEFYLEAGAPP